MAEREKKHGARMSEVSMVQTTAPVRRASRTVALLWRDVPAESKIDDDFLAGCNGASDLVWLARQQDLLRHANVHGGRCPAAVPWHRDGDGLMRYGPCRLALVPGLSTCYRHRALAHWRDEQVVFYRRMQKALRVRARTRGLAYP